MTPVPPGAEFRVTSGPSCDPPKAPAGCWLFDWKIEVVDGADTWLWFLWVKDEPRAAAWGVAP